MKNWKFILSGIILCSLISLPVFAQRYHTSPVGSKGFPDYLGDYEALVRYSYECKYDRAGFERLFQLDTVSWEEMREHYDRYVDAVPPANIYAGKDSVGGIWTMLMVRSPLERAPLKEARAARGIWLYPPLQLVEIQNSEGQKDEKLFDRLLKKVPNKSVYKNIYQKKDSKQIYPEWYDGPLTLLNNPLYYMGFIVSGEPSFFYFNHGRPEYITEITRAPDFYSSLPIIFDGTWASGISDGMYQFSMAASSSLQGNPGPKAVRFTWMLTIDTQGKQDAVLLSPKNPDRDTKMAFNRLQSFVRNLRAGMFQVLYTSDGRILPGRYIKALYDERGWWFEDFLPSK